RLGFAPPGYGALKGELARAGISEDQMVEAGLLIRPHKGEESDKKPYDRFRRRIMFPITDPRGRVIAFGGRIFGDGEPKYLNSPETPLFHKGRVLYGQAQASAAARQAGTVVVVEGYMDVIALHQAGFKHVVAPLGTALTEDQLAVLWRLAAEPILCFDGDNAGRRAAAHAAERALPGLKPGRGLRFTSPPAGEDPDSLIAGGGPDAFARVIAGAEPLSEVLWRMEAGTLGTGTPEARSALQKRLEDHARRIIDPTVRSHFINTFKDRVWNAARNGDKAKGGPGRGRRTGTAVVQDRAGPAYRVDSLRDAQQTLVAIIINHPDFFQGVEEQFGSIGFDSPPLDFLRQELVSLLSGDPGFDTETLKEALRERGLSEPLEALYSDAMLRRHRRIGPGAGNDDILETWNESLEKLRRTALRAELEGEALPEAPTDEDLRRRMALKRAELGDG
ncbi:MAG TPA: toprim domain-containing protein, partial [Alphaproteobacteria bacterium]|nr:toprim domain-containing protein [Alphaproteobacteria bacterium]